MDTPEQRKADKSPGAERGDFGAQRGRRTAYGSYLLVLQPGEKLETEEITITAMRAADSVEITCRCTKARPDRPDCETVVNPIPGGISVSCSPVGGCSECGKTIRIPNRGLLFEAGGLVLL